MKTVLMTTMALGCALALQLPATGCCGSSGATCKGQKGNADCPAGACLANPATAPVAKEAAINTEALVSLLRARTPLSVLDARYGKYDDGRRVPGAKALAPTAKDEEVTALLPDKSALIVTYCAGLKCPASHMLGEKLRGMGYANVLEYHEGIEGWVAAGNAVEKAAITKGKE